ncbi:mitochondrial ribosomal protein L17 [Armillaria fumosa]|nr:mitochondrial ribosomal protein L17 [Armillaria fumosa]
MKHGVAFRKFSRTTSHRNLMLRNLVTSLFEHEQIKTTLPKAKDAARLAEKIITLGKKGNNVALTKASAFLLKQDLIPKLFGTFAHRYADRPGGYTRIHKYGNRPGDNAPVAILELVDNPRDLRWEITSRAIGWEMLKNKLKAEEPLSLIQKGAPDAQKLIQHERGLDENSSGVLRPKTRWNLQKVLRYKGQDGTIILGRKVEEYFDHVLASTVATKALDENRMTKAGQMLPGETRNALHLARGALGHQKPAPSEQHVLSVKNMFKKPPS